MSVWYIVALSIELYDIPEQRNLFYFELNMKSNPISNMHRFMNFDTCFMSICFWFGSSFDWLEPSYEVTYQGTESIWMLGSYECHWIWGLTEASSLHHLISQAELCSSLVFGYRFRCLKSDGLGYDLERCHGEFVSSTVVNWELDCNSGSLNPLLTWLDLTYRLFFISSDGIKLAGWSLRVVERVATCLSPCWTDRNVWFLEIPDRLRGSWPMYLFDRICCVDNVCICYLELYAFYLPYCANAVICY